MIDMIDSLALIKEKFISWNANAKHWSFEEAPELHDGKYPYITITTHILDRYNDRVQLYAQIYPCDCCADLTLTITDGGFLSEEFQELKKEYLFRDPLTFFCALKDCKEGMDYYFSVLSCAGSQIGFTNL